MSCWLCTDKIRPSVLLGKALPPSTPAAGHQMQLRWESIKGCLAGYRDLSQFTKKRILQRVLGFMLCSGKAEDLLMLPSSEGSSESCVVGMGKGRHCRPEEAWLGSVENRETVRQASWRAPQLGCRQSSHGTPLPCAVHLLVAQGPSTCCSRWRFTPGSATCACTLVQLPGC